jgi:hypothetical protein
MIIFCTNGWHSFASKSPIFLNFSLLEYFFIVTLVPPPEPLINPRRGSATGSYGLPVPPEWLRSQAEGRRGSRPTGQTASGRNSPCGPPHQRTALSDKLSPKNFGKKSSLPTDHPVSPISNGRAKDGKKKVSAFKFCC